MITRPESEFNEFEPRLKSAKNRFQLSAESFNCPSLKLETNFNLKRLQSSKEKENFRPKFVIHCEPKL